MLKIVMGLIFNLSTLASVLARVLENLYP